MEQDQLESKLSSHLHRLCVEIGPRPIGSPANQAAADYIRDAFRGAGLDVEEQPYACTAWEHASTRLDIGGQAVSASANAFSPACDVAAPVVPVSTIAELAAADINGQITLFYGDLANNPVAPKSWFLKTERDDRIIHLLETGQPAALIAPPAATAIYNQVTTDWELDIPAATLPAEAVLSLLRRPGASVHLCIDSRRVPETARNIVARKPGPGAEKVVLMAHFDTKVDTPGATDNGAGVTALLCLAEKISRIDLPFDLEFIAFNGEEYLPIGDDEYLRRGGDDLGHILAAINMDGVGAALGSSSITSFSASPAFRRLVDTCMKRFPGVVWVDPWPESNHTTFAYRGVPSLALGSVGIRAITHTPADTVDQVSPAKLSEIIGLVADIVDGLRGKSIDWTRP
ncbi:MAG: M28 family peptidase [Anaerolineae bacterium]|nr:M28 family peptidase [Anaerolineae bacterium]